MTGDSNSYRLARRCTGSECWALPSLALPAAARNGQVLLKTACLIRFV